MSDKDGLLGLNGHCPTQPQATTFRLTYMLEQTEWKLLGIHVAMKKMPAAAVSDPSTLMNQSGPAKADRLNVLAAENGGQVVFCSSQYNQTTWGAENLIDGQLGSGHGYANQHSKPVEVVFALPAAETLTQSDSVLTPIPWNRLTGGPRTLPLRCPPRDPNRGLRPLANSPCTTTWARQKRSRLLTNASTLQLFRRNTSSCGFFPTMAAVVILNWENSKHIQLRNRNFHIHC